MSSLGILSSHLSQISKPKYVTVALIKYVNIFKKKMKILLRNGLAGLSVYIYIYIYIYISQFNHNIHCLITIN